MNVHLVMNLVKGMSEAERSLFSEVVKVVGSLIMIPATNVFSNVANQDISTFIHVSGIHPCSRSN